MENDTTSNTIPGGFNSLAIGYWDSNGNLQPKRIDSDVTVDEYKCASDENICTI